MLMKLNMKKQIVNLQNKPIDEIELADSIFNIKVFPDIMRPNLINNYALKRTLDSIGYELKWEGYSRENCSQYNINICLNYDENTYFDKVFLYILFKCLKWF